MHNYVRYLGAGKEERNWGNLVWYLGAGREEKDWGNLVWYPHASLATCFLGAWILKYYNHCTIIIN